MLDPGAIAAKLAQRWDNQWTQWLGDGGTWPLVFGLKPPTEREAHRQWPRVQAWRAQWAEHVGGGVVEQVERAWAGLGRQVLPASVAFATPHEVAAALGKLTLFERANARFQERARAWPDLVEPLRALAVWMADLTAEDYVRFVDVADWLFVHPDCDLYVRQLPIDGVDSKWVERHAAPLARLLAARRGVPVAGLAVVAGLKTPPVRRRIRLLDPALRAWAHGLSDLEVPLSELCTLEIPARVALIVENTATALACTDLPGTVLIMGGGFAVSELSAVPWLARIPILYWGDVDTWGFHILAALRRAHPRTVSCLMDADTLRRHWQRRAQELSPAPVPAMGLTEAEAALAQQLADGHPWGPGVRLEQERLDWPWAWARVEDGIARALEGP
jgi:hypothetical protein